MFGPLATDRRRGRGPDADPPASLLIDRYLPEYDVTTVRHRVVEADPETTYDAMLEADLTEMGPLVRALGWLRVAPTALLERVRGTRSEPTLETLTFADVADVEGWIRLAESPGRELVLGAVGRFWRPAIEWREVDPDAFADFDEPRYAKLALSLSVRPHGEGHTLVSYEARTATTDADAERRFRRYWRLIGPFAGYVMSRALSRIAADAEVRADRASGPDRRSGGRTEAAGGTGDGGDDERGGWRRIAVVLLPATLLAVYHLRIRPWHRRWGTTPREAVGALPGDELLQEPASQVTHAVEIDAPPEDVWPWLVQLGQGRGGFYSYDWIERLVGAEIRNVDRIVPELQDLEAGDVVRLAPEDYPIPTRESAPEVAVLESERALVLRPPIESPPWTWAFVLEPTDEGTTRLVVRQRSSGASSWLERAIDYLFWEPAHFVMERKTLREIDRLASRSAADRPTVA